LPKEDAEQLPSYFNAFTKHRMVEDFVASYINQAITVRTTNMERVKRTHFKPNPEPQMGYTRGFSSLQPRTPAEFSSLQPRTPAETSSTFQETWENEAVEDKRFSNLKNLVLSYADAPAVGAGSKKAIEQEMYPMIIVLKSEGRINGDFSLKPIHDKEHEQMKELILNLQQQIDSTNRVVKKLQKRIPKLKDSIPK